MTTPTRPAAEPGLSPTMQIALENKVIVTKRAGRVQFPVEVKLP